MQATAKKWPISLLLDEIAPAPDSAAAKELHVHILHHIKLYTDGTGRFLFRARSGNQYIMVVYHSLNVILVKPFKS